MGKTKQTASSMETTKLAFSDNAATSIDEPAFSNGELGQLQEILFGQQQRNTNNQIGSLQEQVNDQIKTLSNVLNSRLNQLTETFDHSAKQFESRLQQMQAENQRDLDAISTKMNTATAELKNDLSKLSASSDADKQQLNTELEKQQCLLQSEITATKNTLANRISNSVDTLTSQKLDRGDFASMLGELSDRLAKSSTAVAK